MSHPPAGPSGPGNGSEQKDTGQERQNQAEAAAPGAAQPGRVAGAEVAAALSPAPQQAPSPIAQAQGAEGAAAVAGTFPEPRPRPRRRRGRWFLTFLGLLLLAGLAGVAGFFVGVESQPIPVWDPLWLRAQLQRPLDTSSPGSGSWVVGYYVQYDRSSLDSLVSQSDHLDQVVAFGYQLGADGSVSGPDPEILRGVTNGQKLVLLFANLTDTGFSSEMVDQMLANPASRHQAVVEILSRTAAMGAGGVQLDLEGVSPERRDDLSRFVRDLAAALHAAGRTLSLAVPAKTVDDPEHGWNGAYDYQALGEAADYLYLMAYDLHWSGGEPGPVAALPWVTDVIRHAISLVPSSKLILGVPGYGYDWGPDGGTAYAWPRMAQRLEERGVTPVWDPVQGEYWATYDADDGKHTVWYSGPESLAAKLELARQYNLKGVALWRLGFETEAERAQMAAFRTGSR